MAEPRPFPPSARRSALGRAAGLHAASPILVGAVACAAALLVVIVLGRAASARLGTWVVAACESSARTDATTAFEGPAGGAASTASAHAPLDATTGTFDLGALPHAALALLLPLLVAIALAAILAHLVQTRSVWLPRRRLRGAPAAEPRHVTRAILDLGGALVLGAVALGWLWIMAPRLAASIGSPLAGAALIASLLAALAIAWVCLGTGDALVRHAELAGALRMSHADKREDDRLSGADPRWRARREQIARENRTTAARTPRTSSGSNALPADASAGSLLLLGDDAAGAIAGSSALLLGDGVAVAIAWDPIHRPVPTRTAIGHGAHATQLLGLARRHAIAVHRDAELASTLASSIGPLPESSWPRLAEIIAATRGRRRSI